jgi:hypothetical protein
VLIIGKRDGIRRLSMAWTTTQSVLLFGEAIDSRRVRLEENDIRHTNTYTLIKI